MMTGFESRRVATSQGGVFVQLAGTGLPLLLLHGFPQTSLMWRDVGLLLARHFTVIAADLPGYGASDCPPAGQGHEAMSKRAMATTLVEAMAVLGYDRFAIAGHDRGGRVAYRAALDHPDTVTKVAVLDVIPTFEAWDRADARLALAFWPFSLLAQPAPLPERLIAAAPEAIIDNALREWGSPPEVFARTVRDSYADALRDPAHIHAICEEYRAAAAVDREHDRADLEAGRQIACSLLALWSAHGGLANWYGDAGGPLGIWRRWAKDVHGHAVDGGHFFPEEMPEATAGLLRDFFEREGAVERS
ncbi:alpha/beta fold hydrolase [Mesorhizobium retamae]|uniref:Alpha/beta hydrolase n=1 Tax=Mesorhizobium retamae TaxID=2912854 RepID=A0ABS9QHW8_9HYPH|nr:alpha/beta hydrolase [Mesorhizobium sp. IRAMC:0171]MCG7507023.1 alpha/beta hydrolase [Mesorhizobium sp. IRAMC:0171]